MKKIFNSYNYYKIYFWILVGTLSLGQLQRVELPGLLLGVNFYLHEVLLFIFIVLVSFFNFSDYTDFIRSKYLKIQQKNFPVEIFFIVLLLASFVFNLIFNFDLIAVLYFVRLCLYLSFTMIVLFSIEKKKIQVEYLHFQLFSIGIFSLLLGFLQYTFITDTRFLSVLGWDDHYARMIGTYFDPGFTGIILVLTLILGLSHTLLQNKRFQALATAIFSWGVVLTFSRASYVSLVVALICIGVYKYKKILSTQKVVLVTSVLIITLVILAPKPMGEGVDLLRTASITARTSSITQQLSTTTNGSFFIGNGLFFTQNSSQITTIIPSHSRIPDNLFVTVFLAGGIFALLSFIWIVLKYVRILSASNYYLLAVVLAVLFHSQFNNSVLQPFVLFVFLNSCVVLSRSDYKLKL